MSGLFLGCLKSLDEITNVKVLLRVWGPRFGFVVRLLLVATFLDDSLRVATDFSDHTKQVGEQGCLKPLAASSPRGRAASGASAMTSSSGPLARSSWNCSVTPSEL